MIPDIGDERTLLLDTTDVRALLDAGFDPAVKCNPEDQDAVLVAQSDAGPDLWVRLCNDLDGADFLVGEAGLYRNTDLKVLLDQLYDKGAIWPDQYVQSICVQIRYWL